ncbi:MAG: PadR family transcriptional regulator [Tissierellia bacterium]|nr:PadR family transcriptional regulator [Tissierellia bacterium]
MNIQFKKGVLELCVLSLLNRRDFYGYELVDHISKYINISEGTIYPLLRRFRSEGYVTTYLKESQEGPPRKYYKLTDRGKESFEVLEIEWENFVNGVNNILRGEIN